MKDRLQVEFARIGKRALLGRIVEQDEALRKRGGIHRMSSIVVYSAAWPTIEGNYLYIRGADRYKDNDYFLYNFLSCKDCVDFLVNAKKAIDYINSDQWKLYEN